MASVPSVVTDRVATLAIVQPPELALQEVLELLERTPERLGRGRGMVRDRDRLLTRGPGLQRATLIGSAVLAGVLVAQVDLHPRKSLAEPRQRHADLGLDLTDQLVTAFNCAVRRDFDLHLSLLLARYLR